MRRNVSPPRITSDNRKDLDEAATKICSSLSRMCSDLKRTLEKEGRIREITEANYDDCGNPWPNLLSGYVACELTSMSWLGRPVCMSIKASIEQYGAFPRTLSREGRSEAEIENLSTAGGLASKAADGRSRVWVFVRNYSLDECIEGSIIRRRVDWTLRHEFTHVIDPGAVRSTTGKVGSDYADDPAEVRAVMQEVVHEVNEGKAAGLPFDAALRRSGAYGHSRGSMSPPSLKKLQQAAYRAYYDGAS